MKRLITALLLTLAALALAAPVELKVSLKAGDKALNLGESYSTPNGLSYQVDVLRFYISNVAMVKLDGSEVALPGLVLADFKRGATQEQTVMKLDVPAGDYAGIRFTIGVPREQNHLDAAKQKAPLGVETGMYWSWNTGYIFYKFEGKFSKDGKASPFLLHLGTLSFAQDVNLADLQRGSMRISVPASGTAIKVSLDVAKAFAAGIGGEPYDLSQSKYQRVQGGPVAAQAYINLIGAWSLDK